MTWFSHRLTAVTWVGAFSALRLPAFMGKTHRVFHVSLLKRYKNGCRGSTPPPAVLPDAETDCEIERILAHCDTNCKSGQKAYNLNKFKYLQWKGLPPEEANG